MKSFWFIHILLHRRRPFAAFRFYDTTRAPLTSMHRMTTSTRIFRALVDSCKTTIPMAVLLTQHPPSTVLLSSPTPSENLPPQSNSSTSSVTVFLKLDLCAESKFHEDIVFRRMVARGRDGMVCFGLLTYTLPLSV